MSRKKGLPPAVLAALGLSACVDGCQPADLPILGRLFEEAADTQPCLSIDVVDTGVGPCLSEVMPDPPPVADPPPVGPCLSPPPPPPPPQPRVGPCLSPVPQPPPPPVNVCLAPMIIDEAPTDDAPTDDGAGTLPEPPAEERDLDAPAVLQRLIRQQTLPADVLARLSDDATEG